MKFAVAIKYEAIYLYPVINSCLLHIFCLLMLTNNLHFFKTTVTTFVKRAQDENILGHALEMPNLRQVDGNRGEFRNCRLFIPQAKLSLVLNDRSVFARTMRSRSR